MELLDYRALCIVCLCSERKLKEVLDCRQLKLHYEMLNEINVYDNKITMRVCWECEAIMKKWIRFKEKSKHSYITLVNFLQQETLESITKISQNSNLITSKPDIVNIPPDESNLDSDVNETDTTKIDVDIKDEFSGNENFHDDNFYFERTDLRVEEINIDLKTEPVANLAEINPIPIIVKTKKKKVKKSKYCSDDEKPLASFKSKLKLGASEIDLVTLSHEEMLLERDRERLDEYYLKSPFKCNDCISGFLFEHTYQNHVEIKHAESAGRHICGICKCRFRSSRALNEHSAEHMRRFVCLHCNKKSSDQKTIQKHMKNHMEHTCEKCGHVSSSLFRHQAHFLKAHKEKSFCKECNKDFSSRKTFRYHFNVMHKNKKTTQHMCPQCGKVYQWKTNLWRHMKNHKAREAGELVCPPCGKKFSSVATYHMHLKSSKKHVTEEDFSYTCDECGRKYPTKTRLKDHINFEHLKAYNYRCADCDKVFKSSTSLYVHTQNVHKEKAGKDNLCDICGKSYQNAAKLKCHIVAVHTRETPYACKHCSSTFSWYSSLHRHVKELHTKAKTVKCRKNVKKEEKE